ncbi:MAG: prephenate dehydrogenase/arogenate dehydrogenase family protein [Verrucomicrobiaceae bacterium]|nr:prephenate dehydrogenase/arogenate dehydrogenase family protein [Verrucomicrobiaceae bacterium]
MRHLAVLGPGLLGGSVALAARASGVTDKVSLWARRSEALGELRSSNVADIVSDDICDVVSNADLVVIATPVGALKGVLDMALPYLAEDAVITDVCSVKGVVVSTADERILLAKRQDVAFVGAHPMAGSELTGFSNARADLFSGAACAITPGESTTESAEKRVREFWGLLGCHLIGLEPDDHDALVAKISHLPHLCASALVQTAVAGDTRAVELAGAGFRDSTRIALGSPAMWTEILGENREAVSEVLSEHIKELAEVLEILRGNDNEGLSRFLEDAKNHRNALVVSSAKEQ